MDLRHWLTEAVTANETWSKTYGQVPMHPSLQIDDERFAQAFTALTERLTDNYPFLHPRYAGQMLKPPHPAAMVGYLAAMMVNPNNHALDAGPATAAMEREVVARPAAMFGYCTHLGHLTTPTSAT
jgi:glutamate/tyrosine decarboxylase-like PLP-dependent enzyme